MEQQIRLPTTTTTADGWVRPMVVVEAPLAEGWEVWVDERAGVVVVTPEIAASQLDEVLNEVRAGLDRRWDDAPHAVPPRPTLTVLPGGRA